jgi:hypothetical protein
MSRSRQALYNTSEMDNIGMVHGSVREGRMLCQPTTGLRLVTRMTYRTARSAAIRNIHQSELSGIEITIAPSLVPEQGST